MEWKLDEAIDYYREQGAPEEQPMLIALLREVQEHHGGSVSKEVVAHIANAYQTKESLLLALIKRIPDLRMDDSHVLEMCAGPNCGKHKDLAKFAEAEAKGVEGLTFKFCSCMRQCAKGPNLRMDGKVHNGANEALLRQLINSARAK